MTGSRSIRALRFPTASSKPTRIFDAKLKRRARGLERLQHGLGQASQGRGAHWHQSRVPVYAGVPSLVVSLWSVDDEATARIMGLFYRHLQAGSSKKQALRRAKLDYLDASRGDKQDPVLLGSFHPERGLAAFGSAQKASARARVARGRDRLLFITLIRNPPR